MQRFLLASQSIEPAQIGLWVQILFAVLFGLTLVVNLFAMVATRRELEALDRKVEGQDRRMEEYRQAMLAIRDDLGHLEVRLNHQGEERAKALHDRIDPLMCEVSKVTGLLEHQHHAANPRL